jgi:hypothetical protein
MAAPKFLKLISGVISEVFSIAWTAGAADADKIPATDASGRLSATFMPGGAPVDTSAGVADAGKLAKLDATGRWPQNMMPTGVVPETVNAPSSENLTAGAMVNLWLDTGVLKVRKADATAAGKEADGFVLTAVTAPAAVDVFTDGTVSGLTGLTMGSQYFLAITAGAVVAAPPSAAGNIVQSVGKATSATTLSFKKGTSVTLA